MVPLKKMEYFQAVLKHDRMELLSLARTLVATAYYRYVRRCIGRGTIVREGSKLFNCANIKIGNGCLLQGSVYLRAGVEGSIILGNGCALNSFATFSVMVGSRSGMIPNVGQVPRSQRVPITI